ncbi:MAG: CvpA family protein [Acidobacteria bacterium]|nr:CvpA family protein [Acidobacteriota bacterium]MBI3658005.1 CvpA family protein [Acidobacteriota bacterium]
MNYSLTLLDIFAVIIILVVTVSYALKGFFRGILGIGAVCAGFILAGLMYKIPAKVLLPFARTETVANLLGYVSIFIAVLMAKAVIVFIIYKILKVTRLRWFDKVLGALLGFIMGWMICAILFISLTIFPVRIESVEYSSLAPYFLTSGQVLVMTIPQELKRRFYGEYKKVKEYWNQNKG